LGWSKMKAVLRKIKTNSYDELVEGMKLALNSFSISDIENWFKHYGYTATI